MCCKKQNNTDFSSFLQQLLLLLLPDISDPYLMQRAQPLHGYHDDPCSWGGESWSFCSDVVSRDRQQCGKEEEGGRRRRRGGGGHRRTHQKQQRARPDWGDQPFLLLPSRALGQLSNQVTSLSRVASGQLFSSLSLSFLFLSLLSSQCHSLQLLRLMSFFDRILSVPACWFLPLCLNKCKHGKGSFKQAHAEDLSCGRRGGEEEQLQWCSHANPVWYANSDLFFQVLPGIIMKRGALNYATTQEHTREYCHLKNKRPPFMLARSQCLFFNHSSQD